ncbi:MAG: 3-phosphoshikimate 1-carboxyvinyltransferase [FCB group bacterium]|nr:3-phosphoshikimate 1-carboxyvinyltransferase [FCB group bacterium]
MSEIKIERCKKIQGCLTLPGDKSISHRVALMSLLCQEKVVAVNYADGADCNHSLEAVRALGAQVEKDNGTVQLTPPNRIADPDGPIECGNSGTTMRLLAGLLAGAGVTARLIGDDSLSQRPMKRIVDPLRQMNAAIDAGEHDIAPLNIAPGLLIPIDYTMPLASAQIKSSLLLAGLASGNAVTIREKNLTRDHTERMIAHFGGSIKVEDVKSRIVPDPDDPRKKKRVLDTEEYKRAIILNGGTALAGGTVEIPGDLSTASYFIALALMVRNSHLIIKDVGLNPTRSAFLTILKRMGANLIIKNRRELSGEPVGDIEISYAKLRSRKVSGDVVPNLIDEIPILAVLAAQTEGTTIFRDASELRVKETDRIRAVVANLSLMGVKVGELPDGFIIEGVEDLSGAELDSFGDHRIAMAFAVAGMAAHGKTVITNSEAVETSCPNFFTMLEGLRL